MKALFPADDPFKKALLLLPRDYLILAIYMALVSSEIVG